MIEFTGERVVPGQINDDLWNEHVARYRFAAGLAKGRRTLDAGCGTGYGSALLAREGAEVVGVDLAADATAYARVHYGGPRVEFAQGDSAVLPFATGSFGLVVAFEVIEHLENWQGMLAEARRVLRADGHFVVSTPNREYYSGSRDQPNPFHVHEFDYDEFAGALHEYFPHVEVFLENHTAGIVFGPMDKRSVVAHLDTPQVNPRDAHFFVAVCGVSEPSGRNGLVFLPDSSNLLQQREEHIAKLQAELAQKETWLQQSNEQLATAQRLREQEQERSQHAVTRLEKERAEAQQWTKQVEADLKQELREREQWARDVETRLTGELAIEREAFAKLRSAQENAQQELAKAIKAIDDAEERVKERTAWAQGLDRELNALRDELRQIYASLPYKIGRRLKLSPGPIRAGDDSP